MDFSFTGVLNPFELPEVQMNGTSYLQLSVMTDKVAYDSEPFVVRAFVELGTPQAEEAQAQYKQVQERAKQNLGSRVKMKVNHISVDLNSEKHPHAQKDRDGQLSEGVLHRKNGISGLYAWMTPHADSWPALNDVSGVAKLSRSPYAKDNPRLEFADLAVHPWSPTMQSAVQLPISKGETSAMDVLGHPNAAETWCHIDGQLIRKAKEANLREGQEFVPWDRIALVPNNVVQMVMHNEVRAKSSAKASLTQTYSLSDFDFPASGTGNAQSVESVWGKDINQLIA